MKKIHCKNCDASFEGNYCPSCSQSVGANSRLDLKTIVRDFLENAFNLDKGFVFTFFSLLKNPGFVANSYINGKRKKFTNPIKYLIIATAIQIVLIYVLYYEEEGLSFINYAFLSDETNQQIRLWNEILTLEYPLTYNLILLLFFPLPFFFLFRKLRYNYIELLIAMIYFYGTILILIQLIALIYNPMMGRNITFEIINAIGLAYFLFGLLTFYPRKSVSFRIPKILFSLAALVLLRFLIIPYLLSVLINITN
ncbi:MAG: DUF3667 domain-containing protein [Allomuricauda sp.]|nr:MAG: DUF3667 domain-containing protein [Allomuricauda sp.]